jgi:hypothetical protein
MADTKITALTAITTVDPAVDVLPIVDISDTTMAASGTTKKITSNQILGAGGTATLASATITGNLTVDTNTLFVDSANNRVGIGTASPAAPVDVQGSSLRLQLQSSSNGGYATWKYIGKNSSGTAVNFEQGLNIAADNAFELYDNQNTQLVSRYVSGVSGAHSWFLTGSTAMTLNSTGLGVGGSPVSRLSLGADANTDGSNKFTLYRGGFSGQYSVIENIGGTAYRSYGTGGHIWYVNNGTTEAGRFDGSGNLLVGTTSAFNSARVSISGAGGSGGIVTAIQNDNDTYFAINFRNSGGTSCGSISCTTSATAFNLSSDYRLKESVQPLTGGLTRINALKPSIYKWKVDGKSGEGFIAHELADVVPLAVTGEKDAVNEDGSIKPQQVDFSKIVPILVAAIKELTARVEALEA